MERISKTSWFIDGDKYIKLCDKTVLSESSTVLPMEKVKDFFYTDDLEVGEGASLHVIFMDNIYEFIVKKYKNSSQPNPSTHLYWRGKEIDNHVESNKDKYVVDKYIQNLANKSIYEAKKMTEYINIEDYTRMEFIKDENGLIHLKIKSPSTNFIFKKDIDKSTLVSGIVVPKSYVDLFLNNTSTKILERGKHQEINLLIDTSVYSCKVKNIDRKESPYDAIQIRYDSNKELQKHLKNHFGYGEYESTSGKIDSKGHLNFYSTHEENTFKVELVKNNNCINSNILTTKETITHINNYITNQGYTYTEHQLSNLYLSLKTKPFVILAGISGTGKSKIIRLLANSLGAASQNNQYNIISVRPDWNDSTELIGYKNLQDDLVEGQLTKIIKEAKSNLDKMYFVCLDEMNLARVEYYLSDYLSIIESRYKIDDEIITDSLCSDMKDLYIPQNLYLIGTVNMDDTTFTFSRKVLDRANTIEFSDVNLDNLFNDNEIDKIQPLSIHNDFLKTSYLKINDIENEHRDFASNINKEIIKINEILKLYQKQFAYRVRDEILFYMVENKKHDLLKEDLAFDYQIMQKILPTISGSDYSIKEVLINLFNYVCSSTVINNNLDIEEANSYLYSNNIKYINSANKILYMLKGYENDGYVSYWY